MKPAALRPAAQVFVCTNARRPGDPLRSGCGAAGPALFAALKRLAIEGGLAGRVWVTATGCMGQCPPSGCAVAVYPRNEHLVAVVEDDAPNRQLALDMLSALGYKADAVTSGEEAPTTGKLVLPKVTAKPVFGPGSLGVVGTF